ncbi:MAG: type II secretion system F family protein [Gammaproteobacteria bacterium]
MWSMWSNYLETDYTAFLLMVFIAVVIMASAVLIPTFGTEARVAHKLRARVGEVIGAMDPAASSLLREQYLRKLPPIGRALERLPGMERLGTLIEQAGRSTPAYQVAIWSLVVLLSVAVAVTALSRMPHLGLLAGGVAFYLPILKLRLERNNRLDQFEEQLPDALSVMSRALKAGIPFTDATRFVGEELADPISGEFRKTFSDINYGVSIRAAYLGMVRRVPSMSLVALVTAVAIQRETGGDMAEILDKIAAVVRGRFRFRRRVRTLSAEGRMSAWVLILIPYALAAIFFIIQPDYLQIMTSDGMGRRLILYGFLLSLVGIFWIRRVIRIQV